MAKKEAVILMSGGLDSATAGAVAKANGFELNALTISYGQTHQLEVDAADRIAKSLNIKRHLKLDLDLRKIGGSALLGQGIIPKGRDFDSISSHIPPTYVPARNTIFLACALGWAEALDVRDIFIGVNAVDFSGYPDCRPEFIQAFEKLANIATKMGVEGKSIKIHAPLLHMTKAQIIKTGLGLGVDYSFTWSCYNPTEKGLPCGRCDSCIIRARGFSEAGVPDPALP